MKDLNNFKRSANFDNQTIIKKQKPNAELARISKKNLYKAPTVEEISQLRETEVLFNSNLFRLQTEELIKEVSIKDKRKKEISVWLEQFEDFIKKLPEYKGIRLSDFHSTLECTNNIKQKGIIKKICKNKPLALKADQDASFQLLRPAHIKVIGLYPLHATIGPTTHVTINVSIPKSCFHAKDYLNARYLVKRSLYLSYIATHLESNDIVNTVSYTYLNNNHLHPILYIESDVVKKTVFEILATPEDGTFKLSRFDSEKCNLRWTYWNDVVDNSICGYDEQCGTPWYNSILAYDVGLEARNVWAQSVLKELTGARHALQLLVVWMRQRELHVLGDELLLSLVASLVHTGHLNRHMSSYQAIRNIWTHLAKSNWDSSSSSVLQFSDHTGHCNLAAHVPVTLYRRICCESQQALALLDQADLQSFQTLFMTNMPFYLQYDAIINIYNSDLNHIYVQVDNKIKLDYLTFKYPLIINELTKALCTALTDRIECIVAKPQDAIIWNISDRPSARDEDALYVSFGLRLNISNMCRVVDKGPPAYDPQASSFRTFWGDKAELRRFKDGSICEAVYWPFEYLRDKRRICKNIIEYVLKDKFSINHYSIVYDEIDSILERYNLPTEEGNLKVVTEFDEFAKRLRDLKLPLDIASIQGTSDVFSHSNPFPPVPLNYNVNMTSTYEWQDIVMFKDKIPLRSAPEYIAPTEAIVQMVQHSKWPGELEAMNALRTAFFLQMSTKLKQDGLIARAHKHHLDVVSNGLVIRLDLFHPKELGLLEAATADERELRCIIIPKLRGALAGLRSRCPILGSASALAHRWIRSQLLDTPPTVVELLVAAACVPNDVALPQRAFLCFLALLSRHLWNVQPLILDVTDEFTQTQRDHLDTEFQQNRHHFPPMCIITPWDLKSRITVAGPTLPHLQRLKLLATQSLKLVEQQVHSSNLIGGTALFKPNLMGYHVIIHLNPKLNARRNEMLFTEINDAETKLFDPNVPNKMPIVGFNPAEVYLRQLRDNYDEFAVFFHDVHGGDVIGVMWKPNIKAKKDFKVAHVAGSKLLLNEEKLQVNTDVIIEDFYILGKGLVKNIEIL